MKKRLTIYVAAGACGGDGTRAKPFGSIAEAKELIRRSGANLSGDVHVIMGGGIYQLSETEVFTPKDGGGDETAVVYRAAHGARPVVKATLPVSGWKPLDVSQLQYPPDERILPFVYEADLPMYRGKPLRFGALYRRGKRLPCARSELFSSRETFREFRGKLEERSRFAYDGKGKKVVRDWDNIRDIRLHSVTAAAWQYAVLPLERVDTESGELFTAVPSPYLLTLPYYWGGVYEKTHLENSISFFSREGDWAVDTLRGKVYLYSRGEPQDIEAPCLTELMRIEGEFDGDERIVRPVENLIFDGITFTQTDLFVYPEDYTGNELQHAWDLYSAPNAMVRMRGVRNVKIENCAFVQGASAAVRAERAAEKTCVDGNLIEHIGMGGILFAGYGPGKQDGNRDNRITNNLIREIGEIYYGSNAVFLWQSGGNLVAHNRLENLPYSGIVVSGRIEFAPGGECCKTIRSKEIDTDVSTFQGQKKYLFGGNNIIEYNDLSHMVRRLADGNGIYVSGTADGNVIRKNIIRDTVSDGFVGAIRMDDCQYGTSVEMNIVHDTGIGCGIENKQCNRVVNNFIYNLYQKDEFWFSYLSSEVAPVRGAVFKDNVVYAKKAGNLFYDRNLYGERFDPFEMKLSGNIYFCEQRPDWAEEHLEKYRAHGNEVNSFSADPMFYAPQDGDFRLHFDSPAVRAGIKQFDIANVGLENGFRYKRKGRAAKLFVNADNRSSLAATEVGGKMKLNFSARNKFGVPIPVKREFLDISLDDENTAIQEGGQIVAKHEGRTVLRYRYTCGKRVLRGSLDVLVGKTGERRDICLEE